MTPGSPRRTVAAVRSVTTLGSVISCIDMPQVKAQDKLPSKFTQPPPSLCCGAVEAVGVGAPRLGETAEAKSVLTTVGRYVAALALVTLRRHGTSWEFRAQARRS
ncbi:hypothetical protein JG688_00004718 [Phytophthora aleatoria]|uniref:Uncharacterized protein n=1 Tax=Phytophthora aleatoria TaxID=2496075 RepID=A0A8J5JDS8_9STRA|nr:hypothetical protein JG688_00004718 [Phytophthora aleatoria]